jgi:hypothetical protein
MTSTFSLNTIPVNTNGTGFEFGRADWDGFSIKLQPRIARMCRVPHTARISICGRKCEQGHIGSIMGWSGLHLEQTVQVAFPK